jgi:nucleoside-diphosphate-sugar epimerase
MRVAVTGASGNLGSALLRRLIRPGAGGGSGHSVLGVARRTPKPGPATPGAGDLGWLALDVTSPEAENRLTEAFTGLDAVVHLAWQLQPGHDLNRLWEVNVGGTQRVIRAAVAARVPQLVVASSVGAYAAGPKDAPVDESWSTDGVPSSSYSRHKAENERVLDRVEADHPDLAVTRLRPALVLQAAAAREITGLFLGPLFPPQLAGRLRLPALTIPREFRFQTVHADDVAGAVAVALEHRVRGGLNVAGEGMLTPDDLARALGARRSVPVPLAVVRAAVAASWHARLQPTEPGWVDLMAAVPNMSTQKLTDLGWRPSRTGVEALHEVVEGIRTRRHDPDYPPLSGEGHTPGAGAGAL